LTARVHPPALAWSTKLSAGTRRLYRARPEALAGLSEFLDEMWGSSLDTRPPRHTHLRRKSVQKGSWEQPELHTFPGLGRLWAVALTDLVRRNGDLLCSAAAQLSDEQLDRRLPVLIVSDDEAVVDDRHPGDLGRGIRRSGSS
jgi:hypothetical protein